MCIRDRYVAYDQTTEYEQLLQNWIDISDVYNNSAIDEEYSQYAVSYTHLEKRMLISDM